MPFAAFADNAIVCPACGGSVTKQERRLLTAHDDFYKCDKCGKWAWANKLGSLSLFSVGDQQILDAADSSAFINFSFNNGHLIPAEKFTPGGGSTSGGGAGRKDLPGYINDDDNNVSPAVDSSGQLVDGWYNVTPVHVQTTINPGYGTYKAACKHSTETFADILNSSFVCDGLPSFEVYSESASGFTSGYYGNYFRFYWTVTIPAYSTVRIASFGKYELKTTYKDSSKKDELKTFSNSIELNKQYYMGAGTVFDFNEYLQFGDPVYMSAAYTELPVVQYKPPKFNNIVSKTNITINKNTWNGNIYVDNSNNLTYIYPQYTTVNEKNETVTNISTNPIIYNNEEHKYYTYDTVSNNFYYISYGTSDPSATPTPKPTFKPGGGSSRGGGVGRHHGDDGTSDEDWYKSYYILNDYDYDCYYGNFYVDNGQGNTYGKSKTRVSTTAIPIADGTYKVTVPDDVNWRAWRWDADAKVAVPVNSDTWKSSMYYDFYASEDIIFEFCKIDGSQIKPKEIILRLDNPTIVEYEPGGKKHGETVDPILPDNRFRIIPNMTSNTFNDSHGTWSAFGSSEYSSSYTYFRAFTVDTSYWWTSSQSKKSGSYDREMPCWLAIEIPDPENYYIDGYVLKGAGYGIYYDDWHFQYSDDGSNWYDLDSVSDGGLKDQKEHDFNVTVHKAHKYYRWYFTKAPVQFPGLGTANLYGYNAKDVVVPTPTPAPSPTPSPSVPPTPTTPPTPGGDKPGGSGSGSGSGDNSWNPFKWLTDLLKDLIEDILKGLWKLLTSIFGFVLWLVSLLFKLFPWMPNSGILALCAGVVVVTVIRIIKFITGR